MPSGLRPTGTVTTLLVARSTTKTLLPSKLVTARWLPSGEIASPCGVSPTTIFRTIELLRESTTVTGPDMWFEAENCPFLPKTIQCGFAGTGTSPTSFLAAVSITSMTFWPAPLIAVLWFGTYRYRPPGLAVDGPGEGLSTFTVAVTARVAVSTTAMSATEPRVL